MSKNENDKTRKHHFIQGMDGKRHKKRIVFCWPLISGYMAACWQELSKRPDIDLFVIGFAPKDDDLVAFSSEIMAGVEHRLLINNERYDWKLIRSIILSIQPDMLFISGWFHPPYKRLYYDKMLGNIPIVLVMDNTLRLDWRQRLAPFLIRPILNRVRFVFVPGERSWQLARYWNVPEYKIIRGLYSVDFKNLSPIYNKRKKHPDGWPKSFLFSGRYHPRKGIDVMLEGYDLYHGQNKNAWPLRCCGMGPLASELCGVPGVEDFGFLQPKDMLGIWAESGSLILFSRFESWGQVIVEACATGLPVLCTEACGASVELIKSFYNGLVVPADDPKDVAKGLQWLHDHYDVLPEMGARSQSLGAAYSAEMWTNRVCAMVEAM